MLNCVIGLLIEVLFLGGVQTPFDDMNGARQVVVGGHLQSDIMLHFEAQLHSAFIVIVGKRPCITPENITAVDPETNLAVPFVIENATRKDGESVWRLKPANEFNIHIRAVIDIDFVNRCSVA